MERLQQVPYTQVENISYFPGVTPPIIENVLPSEMDTIVSQEAPINFIEAKVRRLTWDMFHSEEERNPMAVARFYELMGKSFTAIAEQGSPQDTSETEARITRLHFLRESFYATFPNERPKDGIQKSGYGLPEDVLTAEEIHDDIANLSPTEKQEGLLRFKESKLVDMQTLLGELYNVHDKTTTFSIKNGHLYFDALSKDKPFDEFMAFFVAVSEKDNTPESRRHFEELYSYIEIGLWAQTAQVGEQYAMASSSGVVEGTRYTNNYVDVGEVKNNESGEKFVEVTRFKSPLTHEEYKERFLQEDSTYLQGREDIPIDAALFKAKYFSKDRFPSQKELYETIFKRHPDAIDEVVLINEIYKPCMPYIVEYIERLCNFTSWRELGEAYRSVIIASQVEFQKYQHRQKNNIAKIYVPNPLDELLRYDIDSRAGVQAVQTMNQVEAIATSGGCGEVSTLEGIFGASAILSSQNSIQVAQLSAIAAFLSNTPGQSFASSELADSMGSRVVRCPACKYEGVLNIRPMNGFLNGCKNPGDCPNRAAIVCDKKMSTKQEKEKVPLQFFLKEPGEDQAIGRKGNILLVNFGKKNESDQKKQNEEMIEEEDAA